MEKAPSCKTSIEAEHCNVEVGYFVCDLLLHLLNSEDLCEVSHDELGLDVSMLLLDFSELFFHLLLVS